MATILEFRASDERLSRPRRNTSGPAEIVIFPGIRYERWREREIVSDARHAVPTRDVLKLVD